MKLKELIKIAKQKSYDYENLDIEDLLSSSYHLEYKRYKVNIASAKIVNKDGNQIGYIDYNTRLTRLPKIGEIILMHNKYVGRVKKINFNQSGVDAGIWIDVAYCIDDIDVDYNLLFDAGTINY